MKLEESILTERLSHIAGRAVHRYGNFKTGRPGNPRLANTTPGVPDALWLDFSDLSTITFSGRLISAIADKSAAAANATLTAGICVSAPYSYLDDRQLPGAWMNYLGTYFSSACSRSDNDCSTFVAAGVGHTSGSRMIVGSASGQRGLCWRLEAGGNLNKMGCLDGETTGYGVSTASWTVGSKMAAGLVVNGASGLDFYLNSPTPEHIAATISVGGSRTLVLGRQLNAFGGNEDYYGGWYGEVLVYSTALSSSNAAEVINYLRTKWGTL